MTLRLSWSLSIQITPITARIAIWNARYYLLIFSYLLSVTLLQIHCHQEAPFNCQRGIFMLPVVEKLHKIYFRLSFRRWRLAITACLLEQPDRTNLAFRECVAVHRKDKFETFSRKRTSFTTLTGNLDRQDYLPDFVMIISVPSSLKRSHSSRLSKVAVTPSRSCKNPGEAVGLVSFVRLMASLLLCRHKDLSLFVSVLSRMVSWSDARLFLFASTSVAEKKKSPAFLKRKLWTILLWSCIFRFKNENLSPIP